MTTKRKSLRARRSAPPLPEPSANQIAEAMLAFASAKTRFKLMQVHEHLFIVRFVPEMLTCTSNLPDATSIAYSDHNFTDEASARQWREREIIREAITAGMRARP